MEGRVWATLCFCHFPFPPQAISTLLEERKQRVLDNIDPTWPRTWALKVLRIPAWRAGQRGVLRKLGFSRFTTQAHSQENWLHPERECWGRRVGGRESWEDRGVLGSFPQESTHRDRALRK